MFCKSCGAQLHDQAIVCIKCGIGTDERQQASSPVGEGLVAAGYVLAFLMPLIGALIGMYVLAKQRPGHGIGILVVAFLWAPLWLVFGLGIITGFGQTVTPVFSHGSL